MWLEMLLWLLLEVLLGALLWLLLEVLPGALLGVNERRRALDEAQRSSFGAPRRSSGGRAEAHALMRAHAHTHAADSTAPLPHMHTLSPPYSHPYSHPCQWLQPAQAAGPATPTNS